MMSGADCLPPPWFYNYMLFFCYILEIELCNETIKEGYWCVFQALTYKEATGVVNYSSRKENVFCAGFVIKSIGAGSYDLDVEDR